MWVTERIGLARWSASCPGSLVGAVDGCGKGVMRLGVSHVMTCSHTKDWRGATGAIGQEAPCPYPPTHVVSLRVKFIRT